jgi:hypothetical protein
VMRPGSSTRASDASTATPTTNWTTGSTTHA